MKASPAAAAPASTKDTAVMAAKRFIHSPLQRGPIAGDYSFSIAWILNSKLRRSDAVLGAFRSQLCGVFSPLRRMEWPK